MKKIILVIICFVFSFQIAKAQLYYFFDKKNNTKEIINFIETPIGVEISQKSPNATKWQNVTILKAPPKIGGTYTVQFPDKSKHQITPILYKLKVKNLKTGITRTFENKMLYLFRDDNAEYLEFQGLDKNNQLLDKPIWHWISKNGKKTFITTKVDIQNDTYTLSLPNENGSYTLKSVVNEIEYVNSYELTSPNGEKKIFFLETMKYE